MKGKKLAEGGSMKMKEFWSFQKAWQLGLWLLIGGELNGCGLAKFSSPFGLQVALPT